MKPSVKVYILIAFYTVSLLVGLIFICCSDNRLSLLGIAFLLNFANGLICFALYKELKLRAFFRIVLFTISIPIIYSIYVYYSSVNSENAFFMILPIFVNIVGVFILVIARLVLCKENRYIILNFAVFPIALLISNIISGFEIILMAATGIVLVVIVVCLIWYGGDPKLQYSEKIVAKIRYTTDGHTMRHCYDNIYHDENNGKNYILTNNGDFIETT